MFFFLKDAASPACVVDKAQLNRLHKKKMMADGGKHEERII